MFKTASPVSGLGFRAARKVYLAAPVGVRPWRKNVLSAVKFLLEAGAVVWETFAFQGARGELSFSIFRPSRQRTPVFMYMFKPTKNVCVCMCVYIYMYTHTYLGVFPSTVCTLTAWNCFPQDHACNGILRRSF